MSTVEIRRPDPEVVEVWIDGEHLTSANHDEEGWAGMEAVVSTASAVAHALGAEVIGE